MHLPGTMVVENSHSNSVQETINLMAAVLAMDESILDADQMQDLIKKEDEIELLKIEFNTQILDFRKSLNCINSACEEVRNSVKLKEIMKKILYVGNTLNQGTARGAAVGFKMDSLLKLTDTRASNSRITLMHYILKVLAKKSPDLLDLPNDFVHLEAASKIQIKNMVEEMHAIFKGLEKVKRKLIALESDDDPVAQVFHKSLKDFVGAAQSQVSSVKNQYVIAVSNVDALSRYFGEDPESFPFEQVTTTLLNFLRLYQKAHEDNCKLAEFEKKKIQHEAADMENNKGSTSKTKEVRG